MIKFTLTIHGNTLIIEPSTQERHCSNRTGLHERERLLELV